MKKKRKGNNKKNKGEQMKKKRKGNNKKNK